MIINRFERAMLWFQTTTGVVRWRQERGCYRIWAVTSMLACLLAYKRSAASTSVELVFITLLFVMMVLIGNSFTASQNRAEQDDANKRNQIRLNPVRDSWIGILIRSIMWGVGIVLSFFDPKNILTMTPILFGIYLASCNTFPQTGQTLWSRAKIGLKKLLTSQQEALAHG
jgi:hypothetical protein